MEELIDKHEIYKPYSASCSTCRNKFDVINFTCAAFPKGIPDTILSGQDKHLMPIKNQRNELVFSPI